MYRLKVTNEEEDTFFYGPFNDIGAARGQRTKYAKESWNKEVQIQVAYTEWSDVQ
ncbi:hypothetical protein ABZ154_09140 [Streptomyces sp. NPDC006261]|uniref:hypothetical protein n=1 Tax=Streptomyces sp. NPDC006261 TaxID=3156739 RepID=UPI0033AA5DA3